MPKISVIVPVYKVEAYLHKCVNSILNQTYKNIEIILVDDGSPDNCGKICDDYAIKDNRVRVIHQKNKGVSTARNKGIDLAKGEYVLFVDSDDYLSVMCIEILLKGILDYNSDICVSSIQMVSPEGEKLDRRINEKNVYYGREIIEHFGRTNNDTFRSPHCKLVKIEICRNNKFPENRSFAEDFAVIYRWYNEAKSVVEINDELYFYQIREGSAVNSEYSLKRIGEIETLEELLSFLHENNYNDLFMDYLHRYLWQLADNVKHIQKEEECKKIEKKLIKKVRKTIRQYRDLHISPISDPEAYNIAYPLLMWIYWTAKAIKKKFKT